MPLIVLKNDGTKEVYLHTKVLGTVGVSLSEAKCYQENVTEALAEAVSAYISRQYSREEHHAEITSNEILAMIEAVLCDTGYESAALGLRNHSLNRQILRKRLEVIHLWPLNPELHPNHKLTSTGNPDSDFVPFYTEPWNKSIIIQDLKETQRLPHPMARLIAGIVEDKILSLSIRRIMSSVIRELVRNELWEISQIHEYSNMEKPLAENNTICFSAVECQDENEIQDKASAVGSPNQQSSSAQA